MKTKQKILITARKLFIELGYEKTNLRLLAKESGLTTGAIYGYFDGKEEILLEILTPGLEEIIAAYEREYKIFNSYTFEEKLKCFNNYQSFPLGESKTLETFYDNFDVWEVLNKFNDRNMYESFKRKFLDLQVDGTINFFKELKYHDYIDEIPSRDYFLLILNSFIDVQFKILRLNLPKDKERELIESQITFYNEGWKSLLKK